MRCPRRGESFAYDDGKDDDWRTRDGYRACSYCGSMHPEDFFAVLEAGSMLSGTDKNYKVYVELNNPHAGQMVEIGGESGPAFDRQGRPNRADLTDAERASGRYDRKIMGRASATLTAKFYFQHLNSAAQERFIKLYNDKKLNLEPRFGLYRLPFFARPVMDCDRISRTP